MTSRLGSLTPCITEATSECTGLMEATTLTSAVATAVDVNKKVDASKADLTARIKFSIEQKLTMENLCYNIT